MELDNTSSQDPDNPWKDVSRETTILSVGQSCFFDPLAAHSVASRETLLKQLTV
jgi:hypothetical protein